MTGWRTYTFEKKVAYVFIAVLSLLLLFTYSLSIFHSYCNADAGYYVGVINLIYNGLCPYRDFQMGYPPVLFYLMQIPRMIMGDHLCYDLFLIFQYLIALADAYLIGVLVRRIGGSKMTSFLSSLLFGALYYYLEGAYFLLEGLTVLFGLLGLIAVIDNKDKCSFFIAGLFAALSFMTKQYGLVFAASIGSYLLFEENRIWKDRLRNCAGFILGFIVLLAFFILLFSISGLSPQKLFDALSGSGYGAQTVESFIDGVIRVIKIFPFLLFTPVLFLGKKRGNLPVAVACTVGLGLSLIQFFFNVFGHYLIISLPFILILAFLLWEQAPKDSVLFYALICIFGAIAAVVIQTDYKSAKAMAKHNLRTSTIELCNDMKQVSEQYELNSCLCTIQTMSLFAMYPINPSAMKEYAFSFGSDTDASMTERLRDADCAVLGTGDLKNASYPLFLQTLEENFVEVESSGDSHIFVRKSRTNE